MKSNAALTAKEIRETLKAQFPKIKFSVVTRNYSSVGVSYTDALPVAEVEKVLAKYEQGHFDGMTDMYEYSNRIQGQLQVNYLFIDRNMSDDVKAKIMHMINTTYAGCEGLTYNDYSTDHREYIYTMVYRIFVKESY